jgi:pyridoxine 5-phosphate synthase
MTDSQTTHNKPNILLGVNIDHVATIRNARGVHYPDPLLAADVAEAFGADGITAHLREDRRHIRDADIRELRRRVKTRLNLEMANTPEMVQTALMVRPDMVTLVPERRAEVTTEGGLDVIANRVALAETIARLTDVGVPVSLFVDPDTAQIQASAEISAPFIELHTGQYCEVFEETGNPEAELAILFKAAEQAKRLGLGLNAGHGIHFGNVRPILALPSLVELNIGHSLIAEAIFMGLGPAVAKMKAILSNQTVVL